MRRWREIVHLLRRPTAMDASKIMMSKYLPAWAIAPLATARHGGVGRLHAIPPAIRDGLSDLLEGLRNWRIWHLMGTSELRRRYARSRLGQFWLTLSMAVTVVTLGLVWSQLWKMPIEELLPFFAVSFVTWTYLSAFINDGSGVFAANSLYFTNQRMSFSTVIYAMAYRNLMTLAHNAVIIGGVMVYFRVPVTFEALWAVPGLALVTITGIAMAYLIGMVCLRYRDLVQLVGNGMQILFFITPVMWKETLLPPEKQWLVDFNPFAVFLSIMRDPLLGTPVSTGRWIAAIVMTIASVLLALFLIGRYRRRIIYWI